MKSLLNTTHWKSLTARRDEFMRDEDGSLISFSLYIFMAMIMVGGIGVDMMLQENLRVHQQNSTDRAVLAAANLDQSVNPKIVVQDYLAKVGIDIELDDVTVTEVGIAPIITGRKVSINVQNTHQTLLMNIMGVDELPYESNSEATEAINDIEISLVLDVSGSMGSNNKLTRLQTSATDFVEKVLDGEDGRVSMSLIPYSTQVSLGEDLFDVMSTTSWHDASHCIHFPGDSFDEVSIPANPMFQSAHFDAFKWWNSGDTVDDRRTPERPVCGTDSYYHIQPWTNNITDLTDQIDDFEADGNTSIDVAMKWGAALLDSSTRASHAALIAAQADRDSTFVERPYNYDRPDTLKFVILMTDGINTKQYRQRSAYRTGDSNIWKHPTEDEYAVYMEDEAEFFFDNRDDDDEWQTAVPGDWVNLSWPQVWSQMTLSWRAYYLHYAQDWDADDFWDAYNAPSYFRYQSTKNTYLDEICTEAKKDDKMVIFTIGFEVTDTSAAIMESCASTENHFYRVEGLDIETAFSSIANQINQLKLTQ